MTKKHFRALAQALNDAKPLELNSVGYVAGWRQCIDAIANVCQETNPRSDREKFLTACEKGL